MNDREIFAAALKLNGDQRIAFLDAACGQNASLRQQIEGLLSAHEDFTGPLPLMNDREIEATQAHDAHAVSGKIIGRYKLLEEIGEGGMGSVWVAEQSKPIRRKVAIKLIKPGMDSKAVLARFEAERQALAMMDHPNIARVIDGGMTEQGRPYFAMEYVKGVPLIEYCDSAKLSISERLELFVPICKAVQHAHQKGVIHRDLKPSNILVCLYDGKPVPKVIDFGLAKAMHQSLTEKTLFTAHGMMVGTPLYMSPEQAESNNLDVDTRTDIYSLGVILYELLTGSTPLEKAQLKDAAVNEILRLIKEVEPPKPSTRVSASQPNVAAQRSIDPDQLTRSISGDLDWVVMKALEKERSRRYETANGLAEDIRRHLADEPVSASPPSAGYRMRKFIRRNRTSVIAGSAVAIALILGIIGTTGGLFWAVSEKAKADTALQAALDAEQIAVANAELARQEKDKARRAETEAKLSAKRSADVLKIVTDSFQSTNPDEGGTYEMTAKQVLLNAHQALENSELDFDGKTRLLWVLGLSLAGMGDYDSASSVWEDAVSLCEANGGPNQQITLSAMTNLANSYLRAGRAKEALKLNERILELKIEHLGPAHRKTLCTMTNLANAYNNVCRNEDCLELRKKVLALKRDHLGERDQNTLLAMVNLATSYYCLAGELEEAAKLFEEALPLMEEELTPGNQNTLRAMTGLAMTYWSLGRTDEARKRADDALSLSRANYGPDHHVTKSCEFVAHTVRHDPDSNEAAIQINGWIWRRVVSPSEAADPPISSDELERFRQLCRRHRNGMLLNTLGVAEYRMRNFAEAIGAAKQNLSSPHPIDLAILAMSYFQLGKMEQAYVYRARFAKRMALDTFRNSVMERNCKSFQDEVNSLFAQSEPDENFQDADSIAKAAEAYMDGEQFELAFAEWMRVTHLLPDLANRALQSFATSGRWKEAAAFGWQLVEHDPDDSMAWLKVAPLVVLDGDQGVYAEFCEQILEQFADVDDAAVADKISKACLLGPGSINFADLPREVLASALDDGTAPNWFLPWSWGTRALMAYRSGEPKLALTYTNRSEECNPAELAHAVNLAVVAMAQHQLGQRETAEEALNELSQIIDHQQGGGEDYHDLLIARILLKEAEAKFNVNANQ